MTMLCEKSSVHRTNQAPACVMASSINTPGMTGNKGKWSARYSSAIETRLHRRDPCAGLKRGDAIYEREGH